MSRTFSRYLVVEAVNYGEILDTYQRDSWEPGFAVSVDTEREACLFLARLGAAVEHSSTVTEYVYQLAADAKIRPDGQGYVVYFPRWTLEG